VAPQKDICPHGRTYPIKAVAINTISSVVPEAHVSIFLKQLKIIPRLI